MELICYLLKLSFFVTALSKQPANTQIKADQFPDDITRSKILSDAGCSGFQICESPNVNENTCTWYTQKYTMRTCHGRKSVRYLIEGCCSPSDTYSRRYNYVWCCAQQIRMLSTTQTTGMHKLLKVIHPSEMEDIL